MLNTCPHIVGSRVISFDQAAKVLQSWRDPVEEVDPDVVIGYNISRRGEVRASTYSLLRDARRAAIKHTVNNRNVFNSGLRLAVCKALPAK
ncbi:hypothetical protein BJ138DRAFT_1163482 [Hygrophoropsis aurantiaca]|uniref:Uncharacterized protein n=1 Tax=Hygrophoropsis aurantiaca TaxID=72124 RepID=A0ACB7ZZC6_9AGAM|nr:hypothetical protein BJ138DRAFT_1163482 [Hygrophoropsis aurantiaca]